MRNAFVKKLTELAKEDPKLVLLSGDIGNRLFDEYKTLFPDRFHNCGVAEANMATVAAGLASCGWKPITYTITPFNTTRCLEQIKLDICYQNLPVIIVGIGAGLAYSSLGGSHYSYEDIAILRSLPNIQIIAPADPMEVSLLFPQAVKRNAPVYLRMGKKGEVNIHQSEPHLEIGKGMVLKEGEEICLISTGGITAEVLETLPLFEEKGIFPQIVHIHTIKPFDHELIEKLGKKFSTIAVVEEHSIYGGLGSAVAEVMAKNSLPARLMQLGITFPLPKQIGSKAFVRDYFGLSAQKIVNQVLENRCIPQLLS